MAAEEHECDLCKVTYTSTEELEEHNWSLMHHIKIEKIDKGCSHTCELCKSSCSNIIEYGKHLNEDKHKMALSRRSGAGQEELLDSFSNQSELRRDNNDTNMDMDIGIQGHIGQYGNKHSRSLSQPELNKYSMLGEFQHYQQNFRHPGGGGPQQQQFQHPGQRGPQVQEFRHSGGRGPQQQNWHRGHSPQDHNSQRFLQNFPGMDGGQHMSGNWKHWNELKHNEHYFQQDDCEWGGNQFDMWDNDRFRNQGPVWDRGNRGRRRGSFDESFDRPFNKTHPRKGNYNRGGDRDDARHIDENEGMLDRRGRGWQRGSRGRTSSYDHNLDGHASRYENRSSDRLDQRNSNKFSDRNDLKRRNEEKYGIHPEKSRRGNEDRVNRSRKSSRSLSPSARQELIRVEAERDRDVADAKKVTWSDQQCVSSTTDPEMEEYLAGKKVGANKSNLGRNPRSQSPDSASISLSEGNKGKKKGKKKTKKGSSLEALNDIESVDSGRCLRSQKDSTESVLEKAEKLCKKLRSDREKLKKQKALVEKQKKAEKTEELNTQISKLSNMNRENIRGHLDTTRKPVAEKASVKPVEVNVPPNTTSVLEKAAVSLGIVSPPSTTPSTTPTPEDDLKKGVMKTPSLVQQSEPSVVERLAQTRKEIDSIRSKIEGSVNTESPALLSHSPIQRSHSHSEVSSPGLRGSPFGSGKKADHNALLKMVKSPRSTKERLMLADMLRDHAKSQKKLSLPRFNLKFSDLCTGSEQPEAIADFCLESLAPSVQLEIANLIEADVKPDVAELEKLLDNASATNQELDLNALNELGLLSSPLVAERSGRIAPHAIQANSPLTTMQSDGGKILPAGTSMSDFRSPSPKGARTDRELLTLDDLTAGKHLSLDDLDNRKSNRVGQMSHERSMSSQQVQITGSASHRAPSVQLFSSSLPVSVQNISTTSEYRREEDAGIGSTPLMTVKQEKIDDSYEKSALSQQNRASTRFDPYKYDPKSPEESVDIKSVRNTPSSANIGNVLPVRRSKHTEKLFSTTDKFELPTRDTDRSSQKSPIDQRITGSPVPDKFRIPLPRDEEPATSMELSMPPPRNKELSYIEPRTTHNLEGRSYMQTESSDVRSALEKVTAILDGVPSMDNVISGPAAPQLSAAAAAAAAAEQPVWTISEKDKDLNMFLSSQTSSVLEQVYNISVQEETVRSDIGTLEQKMGQLQSLIDEAGKQLSAFTHKRNELQVQEMEFRNTRMKLLAESRSLQGSTSSQGSHSRTTMGQSLGISVSDPKIQSNSVMMRYMMSQDMPCEVSSLGGFSNVESGSQSEMEALSQRRGSIGSSASEIFHPTKRQDRDSGTPIPSDSSEKGLPKPSADAGSFSLLNRPLDKTGFITLEALMKGDSDIGKLLHKSLESIEQGKVQQQVSALEKQSSNESQTKDCSTGARHRTFSIGSDDLVQSGSDGERARNKVSMKYMGDLPDGVSYDTFVKQMTKDNKNKPLLFTVLSSPVGGSNMKSGADSGVGTGSVSSHVTPTSVLGGNFEREDIGYKSDHSSKTTSTHTLTADLDTQSVKSGYSLGEQIKRICDSQGNSVDHNQTMDLLTPRSDSSGEKTLEDESSKVTAANSSKIFDMPPPRNQYYKMDGTQADSVITEKVENEKRKKSVSPQTEKPGLESNALQTQRQAGSDVGSPTRKRLKSKKERDQRSRRKQKESFILLSDTNSDGETNVTLTDEQKSTDKKTTLSEDDIVITGSEDCRTPRVAQMSEGWEVVLASDGTRVMSGSEVKRSLLDEVQLETETQSDEERSLMAEQYSKKSSDSVTYKGPPLSVACMQVFKGDLYVCYNGTEIRRFNLKTGEILKELDCSPYIVHTMTICDVKDRQDILYTAGAFNKLMLFEPQRFTLLGTFDYNERILCLHENWERLFLGLSDGSVSVRSLKTDKELNVFSSGSQGVQCLASTSAGMTKMLCLGTSDIVIYVVDAMTGLLITMLEGHTQSPLCLQIFGEKVLSSAADKTVIAHSASSGEMLKSEWCDKPVVRMWTDQTCIYTTCRDNLVRCYNTDLKMTKVLSSGSTETVTCGIVDGGTLITGFRNGMAHSLVM